MAKEFLVTNIRTRPTESAASASDCSEAISKFATNIQNRLTVSFYQEDDPEIFWIRLHGAGLKRAGFAPHSSLRVRIMSGCLMITSE
ncbi:SymE family type I addiction module toxin [Collimonas fungivorans]|uniref:SymE family type I addiction module toxin n=1 Tax=Collimonas fungivorans TaxID=158899 RepID=UPI00123733F3